MKKYQIILSDPPWSYRNMENIQATAAAQYSTMSNKDICALPVAKLADDNCILFLWVTMPKLNECFNIIKSWGFEYKTVAFTWVKRNKIANSWFWGMGRWTRANAELCLLATKGKPKRINAGVHSLIDTPLQRHSQKPNEVRKRIIDLVGDLPRIELFARERVEGWDAMGFDIDGKDIKESLDKLIIP